MISSNAITSQSQRGLPYGEVNSRNDRRGVFQTRVSTARETHVSAPPVCGFFALCSCRNATTGFSREARNVGGSAANKHTNIKPSSGKSGSSANLTLPDYGRVDRHSRKILNCGWARGHPGYAQLEDDGNFGAVAGQQLSSSGSITVSGALTASGSHRLHHRLRVHH